MHVSEDVHTRLPLARLEEHGGELLVALAEVEHSPLRRVRRQNVEQLLRLGATS